MNNTSVIQEELNEFELELSRFNRSDLLVNMVYEQVHTYRLDREPISPLALRLLREANVKEREQGIYSLCLIEGILIISSEIPQHIPIFIHQVRPNHNPVLQQVEWNVDEDDWILNPYLIQLLSFEENFKALNIKSYILEKLLEKGYTIDENARYIGHFHPYRHALLREVMELKKKDCSAHYEFLFNSPAPVNWGSSEVITPLLFETDQTQYAAISLAERSHALIQGPPGTGKSQVIANLIGRLLKNEKRILLSSPKREALEVIASKFESIGLGDFLLFRSSQDSLKEVIESLRKSWENIEYNTIKGESYHNGRINWYQTQLNIYHKKGLISGYSPCEFLAQTQFDPRIGGPFVAGLPTYSEWILYKKDILSIPHKSLKILSKINAEGGFKMRFEQRISVWEGLISDLKILGWDELSFEACLNSHYESSTVQLFTNDLALRCIPWIKQRKRIETIYAKIKQLDQKILDVEKELYAWKIIPTELELLGLHDLIKRPGLLSIFRIKQKQNKWLRDRSTRLPELIELTLNYYSLKSKRLIHLDTLGTLGLTNISVDFASFQAFAALYDSGRHETFAKLTKTEIEFYQNHHSTIERAISLLKQDFRLQYSDLVCNEIMTMCRNFHLLLPYLSSWDNLPKTIRQTIGKESSIEDYEAKIISTDWNRLIAQFPSLQELINSETLPSLRELEKQKEKEQLSELTSLLLNRKATFEGFHVLISKPNGQLNESDKLLKRRLVNGKRILAKLFTKKRNFPNLQEVLSGDASLWINILKPVWLSSPSNIAIDLPLEQKLFDVAIIDEASQLLLSHSLGTIYRCKQLVVAGDPMQMAPSHYFQNGTTYRTLLDQALFHLPKCTLGVHYRSEQSELIHFSNRYFYEEKLVILPCFPQRKAIESVYLPGNHYHEGTNLLEAKRASEILIERLQGKEKARIGLVAFSEKQINVIYQQFSMKELQSVEEAISNNQIFIKTLEQIQGDECDELIISMGYGRNGQGRFELRLGPLVYEGGDKRLNVLFSRAKKQIFFIHSIASYDIPMSENSAVSLLKKWLEFIELQPSQNQELQLPLHGKFETNHNIIKVSRWIDISPHVLDLMTYKKVLESRGWVISEGAFALEQGHTRVLPLGDSAKSA